jgi:hypothetical protein
MKVLICGSRYWTDFDAIKARVNELPPNAVVINGQADGADRMARRAAQDAGLWVADVPVMRCHWQRHGRGAGHRRNAVMLDLGPELVIAFQRDGSKGTQGTIDNARRRGIPVEVHSDCSHDEREGG